MYKIKRFFGKVYKICNYIPLLWRDEDWDFEYILDLLEFKLDRVSKYLNKENIIAKNELSEITTTIEQTIEHIYNYKNAHEVYDNFYKDLPFEVDYKSEPLPNDGYSFITINAEEQRPLNEQEEEIYSEYINKKYNYEQEEWKAIFDTIKEHGQKWWS